MSKDETPLDDELIGDVIPVFVFGRHRIIQIFKMPNGYKSTWDGGDAPPWKYPELTVPSRLEAYTQAIAGMVDADAVKRMRSLGYSCI